MTEAPWVAYVLRAPLGRLPQLHLELLSHLKRLAKDPGLRLSFNHYESDLDVHISVRFSQPQPEMEKRFQKWQSEGLIDSWLAQGYDEVPTKRRAYELATRLYLHLDDLMETVAPDVLPTDELYLHVFHGLRDNLRVEFARDEVWFWMNLMMMLIPGGQR